MLDRGQDFVRDILSASVTEFFGSYGVACDVVDVAWVGEEQADSIELGSIVGFRGKDCRGGLALVAPVDFVAKLLPVPRNSQRGDLQLRDWIAEMANQLVGRLKNKLSARSIDFDVGTPVCFTGKSIRLVFLPDAEGISLCFRAAATPIRIHLDCSLAVQVSEAAPELRIVPEGDVLLF